MIQSPQFASLELCDENMVFGLETEPRMSYWDESALSSLGLLTPFHDFFFAGPFFSLRQPFTSLWLASDAYVRKSSTI